MFHTYHEPRMAKVAGPILTQTHLCWDVNNKATGWLGALVRVTSLKFWFLRLRDKMLVFAGVVKKCLQHGHSFRLAGVWLKSENLRFACAVTRFCSSRVKKTLEIFDFQSSESYQGDIHSSSCFLFSTLAVPERLWQRRTHSLQQGSVVTPCPAVGPSVLFLYTFCFFCGASTEVAFSSSVSMFHPFVEYQQQWFYRIYPTNDLENDKS